MKLSSPARAFLPVGLLLASLASGFAQYTNGQAAVSTLGQSNFSTAATGTTQSTFNGPAGVAVDSATGKVFVVDTVNNRVLRFSSSAALANGTVAEAVLGQATFITSVAATTVAGLKAPRNATVDSSGTLWVADTGNNRVVAYFNAASAANGADADRVLGQPDFVTGATATSQVGMNAPNSVAVDSNGYLFVADRDNNRVLRFSGASSASNGAPADGLFGQNNYLSNTFSASQTTMWSPRGVVVDDAGNLWVCESGNNRVTRFVDAETANPGSAAIQVIGHTDFTTVGNGSTQSTFFNPNAITLDSAGRLYVADTLNNRVMIFSSPLTAGNGPNANFVLGQTDFTTITANTTQTGLSAPAAVTYLEGGYLWVADSANNRVVRQVLTPGSPVLSNSPGKPKLVVNKSKTYKVFLVSTLAPDVYTLTAKYSTAMKKKIKLIKFTYKGEDVTNEIQDGTFKTALIARGAKAQINVAIVPRSSAAGAITINYTAKSTTQKTNTDSQKVQATIQK